ncbi:MAG: hypothetical protein NTZ59_13405 [Bacteroidetes bacterium]|nr:hypothetical protein [Bacteroidota bacterium]
MKKQIILSIKFVIFLVVILVIVDGIIGFGIRQNTTSVFAKPIKICNNINAPSIAIFSSSVGEMGYDCDIIESTLHQTAYNFSLNGTRFLQYKGLIDELSNSSKNTKIVVLSEAIFSFEKLKAVNEIERFLPCISNNNVYKSLHNIQPDLTFKCRYIPFYKYIAASSNYYLNSFIGLKNFISHKKNIDSLKGQTRVYRNWEADQDTI